MAFFRPSKIKISAEYCKFSGELNMWWHYLELSGIRLVMKQYLCKFNSLWLGPKLYKMMMSKSKDRMASLCAPASCCRGCKW